MTTEQIGGSTEIDQVIYNNQLHYSQYRWREMIIFKMINLALKDIDRHQVQITNMSNLRERERERERERSIQKYQQQCCCYVNIYIFYGETERETENN